MSTAVLPPFVPYTLEQLKLAELLAAFPGEELEGLRFKDAEPYISPSQIKMVHRCAEQYRRRYVKGDKDRPGAALVWGSADHKTFENHYGLQLQTGKGLSTPDVESLFATMLDEQIEKDGGVTEVVWDDKTPNLTLGDANKAAGELKDKGVALASTYRELVAPWVKPTAVEERFEVRLEGLPVPIRGAIDLIAMLPETGTAPMAAPDEPESGVMDDARPFPMFERIVDRKTSGRKAMSNEWHIQGRIYQLVKPLPIEWQLSVKTKTPSVVAFDPGFTFDPMPERVVRMQMERAIALIAHCFETYGPDEPWPDGVSNTWACGYCGFRPSCDYWATS